MIKQNNMRYAAILSFALIYSVLTGHASYSQQEVTPVKIKINRIILNPGTQYALYVPTFEFHMNFQKTFDTVRSSVSADYDYRRQDMGFGMTHALYKYAVNPGISIDDNLYFREVFSDSTGIWRRSQSIRPFLFRNIDDKSSVVFEFKIEREWSPKIRMGSKIISNIDNSAKIYYLFNNVKSDARNHTFLLFSFERSFKVFKGEYEYLLFEAFMRYSKELTRRTRFKTIFSFNGNLTSKASPIYFMGGHSTLIGHNTDEYWGSKAIYLQNLVEFKPFPEFAFSIKNTNFRRISFLCQFDIGQVRGKEMMKDLKPQNRDYKIGIGAGLGVNTDLPFMEATDLHFIVGVPSNDITDIKFYAGFGGWIN